MAVAIRPPLQVGPGSQLCNFRSLLQPEFLARYALRPRNTIRARGSWATAGAAGGNGFEGAHLDFGGDYGELVAAES